MFYTFVHKKIDYFYVQFKRTLVLFKKEAENPSVIIFNPTYLLISSLKKANVEINDDDIGIDNLPGYKKPKKISPINLTGKSVTYFYNYLVNNPIEAKIISPNIFLNGTLRSLIPSYNGEIKSLAIRELSDTSQFNQRKFKLSLEGPITPFSIRTLCLNLQKTNQSFSLNLYSDFSSTQLFFPNTIVFSNGAYSLSSNNC